MADPIAIKNNVTLTLCGHPYTGRIERHNYQAAPGQIALVLIDTSPFREGETLATLTVCLPDFNPADHESLDGRPAVCIKSYSENEGVLEELIRLGIVTNTGLKMASGWVEIPVCTLIDKDLAPCNS